MDIPTILGEIRTRTNISQQQLAHALGVSFVSIHKWANGSAKPSPAQSRRIEELLEATDDIWTFAGLTRHAGQQFSSRGIRKQYQATLFTEEQEIPQKITLASSALSPILTRLFDGSFHESDKLSDILQSHSASASTAHEPPKEGMSAGKNTYTYDAHTYHTKVPPQGIAELIKHYLPESGLILDPFAGSGMTGVASRMLGYDCILNELSPAACFIANRFVSRLEPALFKAGVDAILQELQNLRTELYTTTCRECGKPTEILYTVWSYWVICSACGHEFLLWDHCRQYGRRVREHKILTEFPCPACNKVIQKSRLKRTIAEPIQLGYMCCGSRQQEVTHPLNKEDLELLYCLQLAPPLAEGFYPTNELPDGVNLRQPKNHNIKRVDQFYSPRNLTAMSHLWKAIHHIEDTQLAAHLAFVFTSLYQRVTRLSEFRFWGGSGNTARFNVPYIFNEANVFVTFARKARSIQDHLESTAKYYAGKIAVVENSATCLSYLPTSSIDLIFTDPPFGANINYSEMNILWESWLQKFTDTHNEAIVNAVQGKDIAEYQQLMTQSLKECYRVLRSGHWLLLVFMNSSSRVWAALREAIIDAGFHIHKADIFDKQHGTFKHFVSDNTAGCDLVLHCLKAVDSRGMQTMGKQKIEDSIADFLREANVDKQRNMFLHVSRKEEVDFRKLYSEWTAQAILNGVALLDFAQFRTIVSQWIITQT